MQRHPTNPQRKRRPPKPSGWNWRSEDEEAVLMLRGCLGAANSMGEFLTIADRLLSSMWTYCIGELGPIGAQAVFNRSLSEATPDIPVLLDLSVDENGLDLKRLKEQLGESSRSTSEILGPILYFALTVLHVLKESSGEAVGLPLLAQITEACRVRQA